MRWWGPGWEEEESYQRLCASRFRDDGHGRGANKARGKLGASGGAEEEEGDAGKGGKGAPLLISKQDHGFCDGAQHQRKDRFRESAFDTAVFFLRSAAGRRKWPRTHATDTALRAAFAQAVPNEASRERRRKAGRGFGDADGGGGVYRGKKGKATKTTSDKREKKNASKKKHKQRKKQKQSIPSIVTSQS